MPPTLFRMLTTTALCAGLLAGSTATAAATDTPNSPPPPISDSAQQGAQPGTTLGVLPQTPLTKIPSTGPIDPGTLPALGPMPPGVLPAQIGNIPQLPLQNVLPTETAYPIINRNHPLVPFGTIESP